MKPREVAEQIVGAFGFKELCEEFRLPYTDSFRPLHEVLTDKIECALLAERERCAKIADVVGAKHIQNLMHSTSTDPAVMARFQTMRDVARARQAVSVDIAAAIRSDGETK